MRLFSPLGGMALLLYAPTSHPVRCIYSGLGFGGLDTAVDTGPDTALGTGLDTALETGLDTAVVTKTVKT